MNLIELISSVSKVAIGAFVLTLVVVGYEVFLLMRRRQNEQIHEDTNIDLPDFNKAEAQKGTFNPISVGASASQPVALQSRRVSHHFLTMFLGLVVLIVLITGIFIYKRNQLTQIRVDIQEILPFGGGGKKIAPKPTLQPLPTGKPSGGGNDSPTVAPTVSVIAPSKSSVTSTPTAQPTSSIKITGIPATGGSTSTQAAKPTPTVAPTGLPQAGSYQTTLLISVVAIAIIYLALIL